MSGMTTRLSSELLFGIYCPSSSISTYPALRVMGELTGQREGTPQTSQQFITGLTHRDKHELTLTPMFNLEPSVYLTRVSLGCGTDTGTVRTY